MVSTSECCVRALKCWERVAGPLSSVGGKALAVSKAHQWWAPHGSSGRPQACSASRASLDTAQCSLVSANAKPSVCLLAQARATRVLQAPPLLRPSSPRRRTSFAARQCHSTLLQSARKDWLGSTRLKELPSFVCAPWGEHLQSPTACL